jgi:hypothetical protein
VKYPDIALHESLRAPSSRASTLKLFPSPNANPRGCKAIGYSGYREVLQNWFDQIELVDEVGKTVHVTSHQFRHTYGTRLINADVPAHIVQALLDHTSPAMTAHYARLNDKTIRTAWEEATAKIDANRTAPDEVLDVEGRLSDAAWSRHRVEQAAALRLANGFCGMSPTKVCEQANPCLSCDLFVPDAEFVEDYHQQLVVTEAVAVRARNEGYIRLAEKADQDAVALKGIIWRVSETQPLAPVRVAAPQRRRSKHES